MMLEEEGLHDLLPCVVRRIDYLCHRVSIHAAGNTMWFNSAMSMLESMASRISMRSRSQFMLEWMRRMVECYGTSVVIAKVESTMMDKLTVKSEASPCDGWME
jgi:hypothetical protein